MAEPILCVENARMLYPAPGSGSLLRPRSRRYVHALDGVDLDLGKGEILGLVGESGSGKTTLAMTVMGLNEPTSGRILFNGRDLYEMARGRDRLLLRRQVQMIFQDPYESLNPRQTIFDILAEPLQIHKLAANRDELRAKVATALSEAGLKPPEEFFNRYPEALSGGQRQRVVIASALILNPSLLVADEPVSMLDVSMRAEILTLLRDLRDRRGLSILYITHDLATAGFFADRIAVMYLGRIVEIGPTERILRNPQHPYTRALLSVIPVPNPRRRRKREVLQGEIPNAADLPRGCRFHPRCPDAIPRCREIDPQLLPVGDHQRAACILVGDEQHAPER
nr:MAG: oligopeptide ABC transporter ATP-binding protein [Chloroflexota bacterium]